MSNWAAVLGWLAGVVTFLSVRFLSIYKRHEFQTSLAHARSMQREVNDPLLFSS